MSWVVFTTCEYGNNNNTLRKKPRYQQLTTTLATSHIVLFTGHNQLLMTFTWIIAWSQAREIVNGG